MKLKCNDEYCFIINHKSFVHIVCSFLEDASSAHGFFYDRAANFVCTTFLPHQQIIPPAGSHVQRSERGPSHHYQH
jgi:hypothetical protein